MQRAADPAKRLLAPRFGLGQDTELRIGINVGWAVCQEVIDAVILEARVLRIPLLLRSIFICELYWRTCTP